MSPPQAPAYNLLTLPTNAAQRRFAFLIGALVCVISLAAIPYTRVQLPELQAYQPALFSTVISFELITAYVLYTQFWIERSPSTLVLVAGYLYSSGMSLMYLLTFPRTFSETGLFHASLQTAPWLYLALHGGFPLAILLHLAVDRKFGPVPLSRRMAHILAWLVPVMVLAVIVFITYLTTSLHDRLPVLLNNGKLTPLFNYGLATPIVIVTFLTIILYYRSTRGGTVMSVWLCIALLASALDVGIILCGGKRFSVGWYIARWNTFVCSNIVLAGMIYEFTRMYYRMTVLYRQVADSENRFRVLFDESRAAERKIAEQSRIIERMLESSLEAIVMCGEDGRVIFANRRLETFFGKEAVPGELFGDYCSEMRLAQGGRLCDKLRSVMENGGDGEALVERITHLTEGGSVRHYECYVIPVADEGEIRPRGYLIGFRDRTEEEKLDEAKDQFVSTISHEIRTPLSSIVGFVEILATRSVTDEKRAAYIAIIQKEAGRLANLINDFLDLQRLTSGKMSFQYRPLDMAELLKELAAQWQGRDAHSIELILPDRRLTVLGDEDRLKQAFHNLISNAIKYSPSASKVELVLEQAGGEAVVRIRDFGLGIPQEAMDLLFTRFYRVDNSDRRKIGGTGLGLSIVKEIVEAHQGKVMVESVLGEGSTFTVRLKAEKS
ncbi:MASE4 domain-containing protein [Gorillibacterium sp. sgz5001074]|uniref:MASE4 domain-containing protein n=1 Tax=Gorillibacterium sp. sgz5001074 TaxID=3446695 RepID=UPI003F66F967